MRIVIGSAFAVGLLASSAFAQTSPGTWNGLPDRFQIDTGYFRLTANSTLRFNGPQGGSGEVDLEQDLGLDEKVNNGCNYIFSKAQNTGKPAVTNLSLGGHLGAHDGTSLYEQSLDALTGAGRIIVAAAGNEGSDQIHLSYTTGGSSINEIRQTIWIIPPGVGTSVVDMWYNSGNIPVGIAAYDAQFNLLVYTNPIEPGQQVDNLAFDIGGGQVLGIVSIDATTISDPNNGAHRVLFIIDSNNGQYNLNAVYSALYTYGYTIEFTLVDAGEPGGNDQAALKIYQTSNPSNVVLDIPLQQLTGGNLQAHYDQPHK